jgi:hypothetical protein
MSDLDLLPGKWIVQVHPRNRKDPWTWEYEFFPGGRVNWRDLNSAEKGSGNWAATSKFVNMYWPGSTTRESWVRPLEATPKREKTWYEASYYRGYYHIEKPECPGFLTTPLAFKLTQPGEFTQTGLLCWAAGSASWLKARGKPTTVEALVKKYKERGKLDSSGALLEENVNEVFGDIGIELHNMPASDFTFCYVAEMLKTKGHLVLLEGSGDMGHTLVVWGVGDPDNTFFDVWDPLQGHGWDQKRFKDLSGRIYVGWAK